MASEFLLITPPEWIEAANPYDMIYAYGEEGLAAAITRQEWSFLDEVVRVGGYLPAGYGLTEMRMLSIGTDNATRLRLWMKYEKLVYAPGTEPSPA